MVCTLLSLAVTLIFGSGVATLILTIVSALFFFVGAFALGDKYGRESARKRYSNMSALKNALQNGTEITVDTVGEYRWYKGFLIGLYSCSLMLLMVVIQLMITVCGGTTTALIDAVKVTFVVFTAPQNAMSTSVSAYYSLLYVVATAVATGLGYMAGKYKVDVERRTVAAIDKEIYGDRQD